MVQQFVDRRSELDALEREFEKDRPGLAVVYGRRRVGKTELLLHFLKDREAIFFHADRRGYRENLVEFQRVASEVIDNPLFERAMFESWHEMFRELLPVMGDIRLVVIDEYPYLIEEGANEEFQKIWDTLLSKSRVFLVLVGSSMSMMEQKVLAQSAPLYGRRSMQLRVDKFPWEELWGFFPSYSTSEIIETYSVLDGIPLYLEQFSGSKGVLKNIEENYLRKDAFLFEEADFLLLEEFREPRRYFSILRAIASGKRRFGEIADETAMDKTLLSKYLSSLKVLRMIDDDLPLLEGRTRLRRYRLTDNYYRFWFRYVFPNRHLVDVGRSSDVLWTVRETFSEHVSSTFEEVVRDVLLRHGPWTQVGAWWDRKGENEIDAIALDGRSGRVLFVETKWTNRAVGWKTVERLIEKSELPKVGRKAERGYLVASRS
ncbi:MAG: ATP-binding protein, partial [Thermoplasmata archaeon]|nr:ATP-binding protein [Thermoplasmata archaeon]